jgi:polyisoprenoid-binding protein YceI
MNTETAPQTPRIASSDISANISAATVWEIDPAHSSVGFSVKHMMIAKVHGAFPKLSGQLVLDRKNIENSSARAEIDASSIDTREPKRDEHLRSPDFFDVQKYPTLVFKSKRFARVSDDEYAVTGDLTIRGVTKEVVLDVVSSEQELKDPWGNLRIGGSATTKIKRKDFGLSWNAALETGGVLVGDEVSITLELQFVKKS